MTNKDLDALLCLLVKHNVSHFKKAGLEISLRSPAHPTGELKDPVSAPPLAEELNNQLKAEMEKIPPDLRADDSMSYDKILNWSGSPDMGDPLPLTGEELL